MVLGVDGTGWGSLTRIILITCLITEFSRVVTQVKVLIAMGPQHVGLQIARRYYSKTSDAEVIDICLLGDLALAGAILRLQAPTSFVILVVRVLIYSMYIYIYVYT